MTYPKKFHEITKHRNFRNMHAMMKIFTSVDRSRPPLTSVYTKSKWPPRPWQKKFGNFFGFCVYEKYFSTFSKPFLRSKLMGQRNIKRYTLRKIFVWSKIRNEKNIYVFRKFFGKIDTKLSFAKVSHINSVSNSYFEIFLKCRIFDLGTLIYTHVLDENWLKTLVKFLIYSSLMV